MRLHVIGSAAVPQGGTAEAFSYEDNGNIAAKAHIGTYTYQTARPHAVMSVSNTDNRIGKTQQDVTYGPLGKAVSIAEGSARLTLSYGPDRQRWRSRSARKWRTDTLTVETLHDGGYERVTTEDGTVREFHRLGRGLVCVVTDGGSPLVLCALTDNVGSYVQMADTLGQTRFRADYDVWGRQTVTANAVDFQRGYGGHEMLPRFALVNMDGRLYDPNLGRFLSPDNYVQAPDDSQSFNRYSYCLNNPLKYTDPTGEVWWVPIVVGAVIGSAVSGASYAISTWVTGGKWKAGDFWKSVGMGAFSGALSAGIGQVASGIGVSKVFANKIGYKLLSQTANAVVTNTVFGNDMDWSDMAGVAASSLFASALPDYKAQKGSAFGNFIRETAHNTALGATSGLVQGATKSLIKGDARYVYEGALGGALSGFSRTLALNALMGAPFEVEKELRDLSEDGIIRKGGLVGAFTRLFHLTCDSPFSSKSGNGIALGSNAYSDIGHILTNAHEFYHLMDIENMGWSRFYATWLMEWLGIYKSTSPTLEQQADNYAYDYYYRLTGHK